MAGVLDWLVEQCGQIGERDKHSNIQTSVGQTFHAPPPSCPSVIHFSSQLFISSIHYSCHLMYWYCMISYKILGFDIIQIKKVSNKFVCCDPSILHYPVYFSDSVKHISLFLENIFDDDEGKNFWYMLWLPIRETVCYDSPILHYPVYFFDSVSRISLFP